MIRFLDLQKVNAMHGEELREAVCRVASSGWYLLGEEVKRFEQTYASYIGSRHCIGVGNGLDALTLIYRAYIEMGMMHPGDEVIVPANTYIASIIAITENQLVPVLVEPRADTLEIDDMLIEQHLTPRTRSVMIVHLYGRCAYTERVGELCRKHNLLLVEDNAQAHGCRFRDRITGSLGHAAGHSFYPGKNLGAMGDAGAVTTDDAELAEVVRSLGNYGSHRKYVFNYCGRNSRMDEMQAAVLSVKLKHLDADNERRWDIARRYSAAIKNPLVTLPAEMPKEMNVWHLFPVLCPYRDQLQQHLASQGVETLIHYPIPPHRQQCYAAYSGLELPITERISREELSLPISPAMTAEGAEQVIHAMNSFAI